MERLKGEANKNRLEEGEKIREMKEGKTSNTGGCRKRRRRKLERWRGKQE